MSHDDTGHIKTSASYTIQPDITSGDKIAQKGYFEFNGSFELSDCSRKVILDFNIYDYGEERSVDATRKKRLTKEIKNRRNKIETLRTHLDLVSNLLDEFEEKVNGG